jgi:hypothetical protein
MIPETLTAAEVQHLIDRGRARLHDAEHVTTPRATYGWNARAQQYERIEALPARTPAPRPVRHGQTAVLPSAESDTARAVSRLTRRLTILALVVVGLLTVPLWLPLFLGFLLGLFLHGGMGAVLFVGAGGVLLVVAVIALTCDRSWG